VADDTAAVTLRQAEALVGIEYVAGQFDCMHLAVLAQRMLFNRQIAWPERTHPRGKLGQAVAVQRHCDELAQRLDDGTPPETGDAVLWRRPDGGYHIGTVFEQCGQRWVLHADQSLGSSVLQRMADTAAQGLQVEGFYRWRA
jgi:hypothetical protein